MQIGTRASRPVGIDTTDRITQMIGQRVIAGALTMSASVPGQPSHSAIVGRRPVRFGPFTIGSGVHVFRVVIDDARGRLSGWTLTGTTTPASTMTWRTAVRLTTRGLVKTGAQPFASDGSSGVRSEVIAGPDGFISGNTRMLCLAPDGGGGGSFTCTASVRAWHGLRPGHKDLLWFSAGPVGISSVAHP
jgi:hypothetical protein